LDYYICISLIRISDIKASLKGVVMPQNLHVVVGLGESGLSCVRYLQAHHIPVAVIDTRKAPPKLLDFIETYPDIRISLGKLDSPLLDEAHTIVLSPSVSIHEPAIVKQQARGAVILGDIELFAQHVDAPVIAITGTNAKSTVTTLVGLMMAEAGLSVKVGGNLGTPALDLLGQYPPDVYVLELSSFQLETTQSLVPQVATILNITPDHLDRHLTLQNYILAKQGVYHRCRQAICNRDDTQTDAGDQYVERKFYFTLSTPGANEFGLITKDNQTYLAFEQQPLLAVSDLPIAGKHYQANALAALAIGYAFGLTMDAMLATLVAFKGLPHRCQLVRIKDDVSWYNDSKGTNVGATLAAINGLGADARGKLILIAGGVGKDADFSSLVPAVQQFARKVILIGEAAAELEALFRGHVAIARADSMEDAVQLAAESALPHDNVLLSPACASFDMFKNFEHRGNVYTELVQDLV
jgi:UDP-N-acetylmuramoylalanine--D-glutamate ligase